MASSKSGGTRKRVVAPSGQRVAIPTGQRVRGFSTRRNQKGLTEQEWTKTERASKDPPAHPVLSQGFTVKRVTSYVDGQGKVRGQYIGTEKDRQIAFDQFWLAAESATLRYRGVATSARPPRNVDAKTLTIYPLGDPHIGLLSWGRETGGDFDTRIAERELLAVVDRLVDRTPPSKRAMLVNLGDFFHAESDKQLTPSGGNKLDVDTRWLKVAEIGFSLMRRLIDRLRQKHMHVDVINVPGNHDPQMSRMLALYLRAVYENEPRVRITDNANPFIYQRFGQCLFGFTHKPRAAGGSLAEVMATDRRELWGVTRYHYWHCGHIHTLSKKETLPLSESPGCVVETHRTLAANDYWHNESAYRSGKSLTAITYSGSAGEISRVTVDLSPVRKEIYARCLSKSGEVRKPKVGGKRS